MLANYFVPANQQRNQHLKKVVFGFVFSIVLFFFSVTPARAAVIIFDSVTTTGTPFSLKVLTKGNLFPQGGCMVDIYLEDKKLGRILSGGDGYGYLRYIPKHPGMKTMAARTATHTGTGILLVMAKTEKAVLVEIEGGLNKTIFSEKFRTDTRNALKILSKKFKLIYLTRLIGQTGSKKILAIAKLPKAVVIRWQGPETLEDLTNRHITLYAIIGSEAIISEASTYVKKRFSFEETEDDTYVADWSDILKRLK